MKPRINWFLITLIFSLNSFLTQTSWSQTKSRANATQVASAESKLQHLQEQRSTGETRSISHRIH